MSTRESVSSIQSTGTSWMRQAVIAQHEQLGVEEPAGVLGERQQRCAVAPDRLNPHCASVNSAPSEVRSSTL